MGSASAAYLGWIVFQPRYAMHKPLYSFLDFLYYGSFRLTVSDSKWELILDGKS